MSDQTWVLPLLTFLPLIGALVMMVLVPNEAESAHKLIALITSLATAALGVAVFAGFNYDASKDLQRGGEVIPVPVEPEWGVLATERGQRCYPHRVHGEGFFIAALRKTINISGTDHRSTDRSVSWSDGPETGHIMSWLKDPGRFTPIDHEGVQHAVSARWAELAEALTATTGALIDATAG